MKVHKGVQVSRAVVSEIICNRCGKNIEKDAVGNFVDCLSVDKRWGYGTTIDNEEHSFDLCEDCYKDIIATFKVDVRK